MPQKESDIISIRVRSDIKKLFYDISERNQLSNNELFTKLIQQYHASEDGKRFIDLQRAHEQLTATCQLLEKQLFDVFTEYNDSLQAVMHEHGDVAKLEEQNRKLQALVLEQQDQLSEKDHVIQEQKELLDYLTVEVEKMMNSGQEDDDGDSQHS